MHPPSSDRPPGDQPGDDDVDLEVLAAELADVEVAMERIEAGTYWTDEVTGEPIPDDYLAEHPTARRASADADAPVAELTAMAEVLADLDAAADADELDIAELDALADAEFLTELGRLDGGLVDDDDVPDDLDVELVVDPETVHPPHPPTVHPPHPPTVHPPHPPTVHPPHPPTVHPPHPPTP